jgi:hypothetical protein
VILRPDGSFEARQMPPSLLGRANDSNEGESVVNGSGIWKLEGSRNVELIFRQVNGAPVSFGTVVHIEGWSTLTLLYWIGDPDSGVRINLEKE